MFGLFKSAPFVDPQLGELRRSSSMWRGTLLLGDARVRLVLSGSRAAPDPKALSVARSISSDFPSWRPTIERALFAVWPHTVAEFVQVSPLGGQLTIEIGYRVGWNEEHTLGARLRDGQLVELCGSVLAP